MNSRVLIGIDTYQVGGPGKGLLQFLKCGGQKLCQPVFVSTRNKTYGRWPFAEALSVFNVTFEVLDQRWRYDPLLIPKAYRLLRTHRIQILQSHGYKMHLLFFLLKCITGLPWVAYVHGWTAEDFKIRMYNRMDAFLLRYADQVVVVSDTLKNSLSQHGIAPHKLHVIKNAVESDSAVNEGCPFETGGKAENEQWIGVIGRFSPEKGQRYFIEALSRVVKILPNVKALLIGDGQERAMLERSVQERGLSQQVLFAGYQKNVAAYYQCLDLVVLPSLSEGIPNVALEAMSFGKPVVASNVGGMAEVVLHNVTGKLVPAQNPHELAQAMIEVLEDKMVMEQYGNAGKQRVKEEFDPYKRAEKMAAIYSLVRST